jgi:hypothetical protein
VKIGFKIFLFLGVVLLCSAWSKHLTQPKSTVDFRKISDTVRIANDSIEYEIIIIEPGFDSWLATAKPRNYFSLVYLENKNRMWVSEWNQRVLDHRYDRNLYEMRIDYQPHIHYGLEVNYLLYQYFSYFQQRYKQRL